MSYESYCAACTYLSERGDYRGKFWCERKGEDHYATDSKCYSFCEAYSRSNSSRANMYDFSRGHQSSGCYITTIACKLLGYKDNNYYLNTLRNFRDNVMQKNPKYICHLMTYDAIGPVIAKKLEEDKNGKEIATAMFNRYITRSVSAIEEEKYNDAINIYVAMTNALTEIYNIDTNIIMPDVNRVEIKSLGHGKGIKLRTRKIEN